MPADEGIQVKVSVKWFNVTKGFGFVAPEDGGGDAFLHISVLNRAGLQQIADGTLLSCMVAPGAKGRQVTRIVEILPGQADGRSSGGGGDYQGQNNRDYQGQSNRDNHAYDGARERNFGGGHDGGYERNFGGGNFSGGEEVEVTGTVKWFKPDKGFGFVAADDGDKDIFIHKSLLRRANIMEIESGQRVKVKAQSASKGREATWIALLQE